MSNDCIMAEGVGIKFNIQHEKSSTVKKAISRAFYKKEIVKEKLWALRDVNFKIGKGEATAIIGRNGSGKTTLLRAIAGIYIPDEGRIAVNGKVSTLLSLTAGFQSGLTGYDNIYLTGLLLGMSKKDICSMINNIIAFSELGNFMDTSVKNYSSGMRARLGFSIAINIPHDILLIDETLAVGDKAFREKCMDKMRALKARGKTIILVSHSNEAIKGFCDRAIWLEKGLVKKEGPSNKIASLYFS